MSWRIFFNKVAGLITATLFKKDSITYVFMRILRNYIKALKHLGT